MSGPDSPCPTCHGKGLVPYEQRRERAPLTFEDGYREGCRIGWNNAIDECIKVIGVYQDERWLELARRFKKLEQPSLSSGLPREEEP